MLLKWCIGFCCFLLNFCGWFSVVSLLFEVIRCFLIFMFIIFFLSELFSFVMMVGFGIGLVLFLFYFEILFLI